MANDVCLLCVLHKIASSAYKNRAVHAKDVERLPEAMGFCEDLQIVPSYIHQAKGTAF